MCSVFGYLNFRNRISLEQLQFINSKLKHRGPDSSGIYQDDEISLAHNRLSIQDLSHAGNQPMHSSCNRFVACFNGEIYNHIDIRQEILGTHKFRGTSDTETLVELCANYIIKGKPLIQALRKCNGIFAFALWDKHEKTLYVIRDHVGVKPLYYYQDETTFAFCSEIKGFCNRQFNLTLNYDSIQNYFIYGHSIDSKTIFKNIYKVAPATIMKISKRFDLSIECYWNLQQREHAFTGTTYDECKEQLRFLITNSIQKQLISDVPVGAFLSGGIDSSTIVSLIQKSSLKAINTFSVGFDVKVNKYGRNGGKYSELPEAKIIASQIGSIHHEIIPTYLDLQNNIEKLVYHYDEPFADPSAFPTYMISQLAKTKVTVGLSGDGADELFGGYRRYVAHLWQKRHPIIAMLFSQSIITFSCILPRLRRLRKIAQAYHEKNEMRKYSRWLESLDDQDFYSLTKKKVMYNPEYIKYFLKDNIDIGQAILLTDQNTWLVDGYLEKVDKASMANSLEVRVPFLDFRLVEFANSIPFSWKVNGTTKKILKDSIRGIIPDYIIDKPKRGFSVPLDEWFRHELKNYLSENLFNSCFEYDAYGLNRKAVEYFLKMHMSKNRDYSTILWHILIFIIWERTVLKKIGSNE